MIKGLMWCLAVLFAQLGLLKYVDLRVAAMPRLQDSPPADTPLPHEDDASLNA